MESVDVEILKGEAADLGIRANGVFYWFFRNWGDVAVVKCWEDPDNYGNLLSMCERISLKDYEVKVRNVPICEAHKVVEFLESLFS